MKKEIRTIYYDEQLKIEAYRFKGITQPFPSHFHDYYVIGFAERGHRNMLCGNVKYTFKPNDILLLNPGDTHSCVQSDNCLFDYRAFNIKPEIINYYAKEIAGINKTVRFTRHIVSDKELLGSLEHLHKMIMREKQGFEKEETLLFTLGQIIREYGGIRVDKPNEHSAETEKICEYIRLNYAEHITLEQLCEIASLSKTTLIRSFTKSKGITPYRYLENIRLAEAKKLLKHGQSPAEAALNTGFSDQSHFTNFFKEYTGLTPGQYKDIFK